MKHLLIGMVLAGFLGAAAADCPPDRAAPMKEGHFGAKTLRAYNIMISLQVRGRTEELKEMVEGGSIIPLPAGELACIRRDVITSSRTWITVPGREGTFWVHSSALDR